MMVLVMIMETVEVAHSCRPWTLPLLLYSANCHWQLVSTDDDDDDVDDADDVDDDDDEDVHDDDVDDDDVDDDDDLTNRGRGKRDAEECCHRLKSVSALRIFFFQHLLQEFSIFNCQRSED